MFNEINFAFHEERLILSSYFLICFGSFDLSAPLGKITFFLRKTFYHSQLDSKGLFIIFYCPLKVKENEGAEKRKGDRKGREREKEEIEIAIEIEIESY